MIGIDCLLKNTVTEKNLRRVVEKLAYDKASKGEDASLGAVYKHLDKAGVEVSLRAVGQLYADAKFPSDGPFTTHEKIDVMTSRRFEQTMRNLILMKPEAGEQRMGSQSLGEHIGGTLADAFYSGHVTDDRTKSVMVQLRDAVMGAAKRLSGELPAKGAAATKENFIDTVGRYIDQENEQGFNTLSGKMNNIHDVLQEALKELHTYHQGLADDPIKQDQFREYIKGVEDAVNSVLFSRKDAQSILHDVMKEAGYVKTLKDGSTVLDWEKMAGDIHDVRQLKNNVRDAMENAGYDAGTASRIADSLQKEYFEMRGKVLDKAMSRFDAREANMQKGKSVLPRVEVGDMINKRIGEWENYMKLADDNTKRISFGRKEARDILVSALKNAGYVTVLPNGKEILDWRRMSREIKTDDVLHDKVIEFLHKEGHTGPEAEAIATAINKMYGEMRQDIVDHANNKLDSMQNSIGNKRDGSRSELERLAELHDLGLFNGGYEKLLNDRLGVSNVTQEHMQQLNDIGKNIADLTRELNNKNYLATYAFTNLQRQVEHILAENQASRSNMLHITKAISDMFSVINVGILANPYNLVENNWSGYQAILTKNQEVFKQMGKEGMFGDGKLWRAVIKDAAMGGVEHGDAGDKLAHISDFSKNLNTLDFKKHPLRALGTLAILTSRTGLNAADAANKAVLHKKSMMLALHQALTEKANMTKEEATHFLNEALYGENFEKAKERASDILTKYGLKNTDASQTRLANDLVLANLELGGYLSDDAIHAALSAGFDVAAIALGHTANNQASRAIQQGKTAAHQRESKFIRQGEFGKAAAARFSTNLFYNGLLRFMGGGMNWAVLRMQSMGLGLSGYYGGEQNTKLDFTDKGTLEESMGKKLRANRKIAAVYTENAVAALAFSMLWAYGNSQDDKKDDENGVDAAVRHMSGNYAANRAITKVGPNAVQLYYLAEKSKGMGHAAALDGALQYAKSTFNIANTYGANGRVESAAKEVTRGNKGYMQAMGDLGAIAGDMVSAPFYRSVKNFYQLGNYWVTGNPIENTFSKPMSVWDGMFGGGLLQDIGVYKPSAPIELIPGVGNKKGAEFRAMGIEKISDLKDHPDWQQMIPAKSRKGAARMYHDVTGEQEPATEENSAE